jgi:hypothetical protein
VEAAVSALEGAAPFPPDPFAGSPAALEGRWELLYANTEAFRSSPFFLAFASLVEAAGGNKQVSDAIFAFTDAIPGEGRGLWVREGGREGGRVGGWEGGREGGR